jgi:acetylornithine/N-succinyldiaminopimelate aminotransferase
MIGIKMKSDSRAFVAHLRDYGVLTVSAAENVMRILPPLIIEEEHIAEFVEKLSAAARAYQVPGASD